MAGAENGRVLERINRDKPQLLFLGMGMPLQEEWILNNRHAVECNVIFQAGACFDYLAGAVYAPPRWTGRIGLEWLFRLCTSPRRVYKRYLWEPWFILPLCIADLKKKHRENRQKDERPPAGPAGTARGQALFPDHSHGAVACPHMTFVTFLSRVSFSGTKSWLFSVQ